MHSADLQWIIPDHVRSESGRGGLPRLLVRTARSSAHVYLHGAHVTHFELRRDGNAPDSPAGLAAAAVPARNVLFISKASHFTTGKAIRGGVPVIFPWFGPRDGKPGAPMHGFARTSPWSLESARLVPPEAVELVLRFESD